MIFLSNYQRSSAAEAAIVIHASLQPFPYP